MTSENAKNEHPRKSLSSPDKPKSRQNAPVFGTTIKIGTEMILEELDGTSGCDKTILLHNNIATYFDSTRPDNLKVYEFVVGFHTRLENTSHLQIGEELKQHVLPRKTNMDGPDQNIVAGFLGGDYSLQITAARLRNAFLSEGIPSSSVNRNSSAHRQPQVRKKRTTKRNETSQEKASQYPIDEDATPIFYSFLSRQMVTKPHRPSLTLERTHQ